MSFPGIPALLNPIAAFDRSVTLLVTDSQRIVSLFSQSAPQWGLYQDGEIAVQPDNIVRLDFKSDYSVLDYPVEKGGFENYNKVKLPSEVRLRMTKGGSQSDRAEFLAVLKALEASTDVVDVYMPEAKYTSMNVYHVDFSRSALSGVGLLSVDVWLIEIMETVTPSFTNTADESGQSPLNGGNVLPADATDAQKLKAGVIAP